MPQILINLAQQRRYWAALFALGFAFEAVALYYQYALDEWPCVLCIHIRIAVFAFMLVALAGMFIPASRVAGRVLHGLNTLALAWMAERSYQVLAVERGWVFGDCDMELGAPDWFAIDKWLPAVFEVKTSCGYTPYVVGQISMAEVLMLCSALLLLLSLALFVASWQDR